MHLTLKRWRVIIFKSNRAIIKWKKNLKIILPCYCNINMKFMKQTF